MIENYLIIFYFNTNYIHDYFDKVVFFIFVTLNYIKLNIFIIIFAYIITVYKFLNYDQIQINKLNLQNYIMLKFVINT